MTHTTDSPEVRRPPTAVRMAAGLLVLVAAMSAVLGVLEVVYVPRNRAGIASMILLVAYAVGLVAVARGLLLLRRWSRGPAVATQVLQLLVAFSLLGGGATWVGVLVGAVSLTVIVALTLPASTRALVPHLIDRSD